ncbi:hypothetical protein PV05_03333 [Exophiala xenobiotica]|uniref:Uncharacterized protein n=1 Tax=Exophiala xenobiotica TaxID=348802 RepID=A0A0D2EVQ0_9EURO|nr:uncharacterized protein PV05_03333 [Exophiala xenobiotica]KIW58840.1 hypothetical protein PV05_03333 [Exophiala xenobiotica]
MPLQTVRKQSHLISLAGTGLRLGLATRLPTAQQRSSSVLLAAWCCWLFGVAGCLVLLVVWCCCLLSVAACLVSLAVGAAGHCSVLLGAADRAVQQHHRATAAWPLVLLADGAAISSCQGVVELLATHPSWRPNTSGTCVRPLGLHCP